MESMESMESTDSTDSTDSMESMESTESMESMESMGLLSETYTLWQNPDCPKLCGICESNTVIYDVVRIGEHEKECKICSRPFTVLCWYPIAKMRFKETEICKACTKLNNVCQTCLVALYYGEPTPIQEQDTSLDEQDTSPDVNRENYIQNMERQLRRRDPDSVRFRDIIDRIYRMDDYDPKRTATIPTLLPPGNKIITAILSRNLGSLTQRIRIRNGMMRGLPDAFSELRNSFFNLKFRNLPLRTMPRPPSLTVPPMLRLLLIPNSIFNAPVTDLHLWLHLLLPITLGVEVLVTLRRLLSIIRLLYRLG